MSRLFSRRFSLVLALSLALAATLSPVPAAEELAWGHDISAALEGAKQAGKPVLVDIWAVWCVPCAEMDRTTYRDPKVLKAVENFIPVKVDADVQKIFIERYRIDAYPTVLVLDGDGNEITRLMGLVSPDDLLDLLTRTSDGYEDYLKADADRKNPDSRVVLARYFASSGNAEEACACYSSALKKMKHADAAKREGIQLEMARSLVDAEHLRAAIKSLRKLSESGTNADIRKRALEAWIDAERARGRDEEADALQARLDTGSRSSH